MNCSQKELLAEFCLLREKIDDVVTAQYWHGDEMYTKRALETKEEAIQYATGYNESRIMHEHTIDLMGLYLKQFDDLIDKLKALDIEKAYRENFDEESRNA